MPAKVNHEMVWIVGAGRVGRMVAVAERRKDSHVVMFDIVEGVSRIGSHHFQINTDVRAGSPERLWFCVPDDDLEQIIFEWKANGAKPKLALHTSGWNSPELLKPLFEDDGEYISFHPMRSLLGKNPDEWKGAVVTLSGSKDGIRWGEEFCKIIGCKPMVVNAEEKPFIHLISQFAANVPFAIVSSIETIAKRTTIPKSVLYNIVKEMIVASTDNALRIGAVKAATGPVARGDSLTIVKGLKALETNPELRAFYEAYVSLIKVAIEREKTIV